MENERTLKLSDCVRRFQIKFANKDKVNEARKNSKISSDDILEYSFYKAWGTAVSGLGRKEKDNQRIAIYGEKENVFDLIQKTIKNKQLNNEWHKNLCEIINSLLNQAVDNAGAISQDSYYGIAQKVVNMTMKYLYCFNGNYGLEVEIFNDCHCPLDRIIARQIISANGGNLIESAEDKAFLENISKSKRGFAWSFINQDNYNRFQNIVTEICKKENITSNLFFDFLYW